jgi:hypothetical protein
MDSYFDTQLASGQRPRKGATQNQKANGSTISGYRLSSDDLSVGLEVHTVNITTLPVELVTELVRMRKLWEGAEPAGPGENPR